MDGAHYVSEGLEVVAESLDEARWEYVTVMTRSFPRQRPQYFRRKRILTPVKRINPPLTLGPTFVIRCTGDERLEVFDGTWQIDGQRHGQPTTIAHPPLKIFSKRDRLLTGRDIVHAG